MDTNDNENKWHIFDTKYITIEEVNSLYPLNNLSTQKIEEDKLPPGQIITNDDDDWAYDRHRDEETIDRFLEERGEPKLFPDESNVY